MKTRIFLLMICFFSAASIAQPREATYELDIAAQPLKEALKTFAQQSGLQVVFFTEIAVGHQAPAVKGRLTSDEAMQALLKGTALRFRKVNSKTVAVDSQSAAGDNTAGGDPTPVREEIVLARVDAPSVDSDAVAGAGNAVISGRLADAASGASLPGALVRLVRTGETTRTDERGYFRFSGLSPGEYTVSISGSSAQFVGKKAWVMGDS
jgi:hypothetical protein